MPWQNVGSPFIVISPANGIFLVYELPGPGLGTLIASIAPTAGVDQYGNPYDAGVSEYVTVDGQLYAVTMGSNPSTLESNGAGVFVNAVGANAAFAPGGLSVIANNTSAITTITSGQTTSSDVPVWMYFYSDLSDTQDTFGVIQAEAGLFEIVGGALQIDGEVADPTNVGSANAFDLGLRSSGYPGAIVANAADTNVYSFGVTDRFSLTNQVVNATLGQINNMSATVQAGCNYEIEIELIGQGNQAGGAPEFQFNGTSNVNIYGVQGFNGSAGANLVNNGGLYVGPTLTNGGRFNMTITALGECTVSGTLVMSGKSTVSGDTFTMQYSHMKVRPVSLTNVI